MQHDGDLRTSIDFRDVYRELLANWMDTRPDRILGPAIGKPLQLFSLSTTNSLMKRDRDHSLTSVTDAITPSVRL